MESTSKIGLVVLGLALALGIAADALLRAGPWGYNLTIWLALLLGSAIFATAVFKPPMARGVKLLTIPFLLFAAGIAVRDNAELRFVNVLGIVFVIGIALSRVQSGRLFVASLFDYTLGVMLIWLTSIVKFFSLFAGDIEWKRLAPQGKDSKSLAVIRGLVVAVPLLLIFGGLLVSADKVFGDFVVRMFSWNFESLATSCLMIPVYTVLAGAVLRHLFIVIIPAPPVDGTAEKNKVGITEIGIVLGSLNLLFLGFVAVQFGYFFGGASRVLHTAGLTYAQYARRGFFELVTVTALSLILLLSAHWLLRKDTKTAVRTFGILAVALIAQLFVMTASAFQRLNLYIDAYGLTNLRFWLAAIEVWAVIMLLWYVLTVVRNKPERFAFGAILSAFLVAWVANVVNPEELIVKVNTERSKENLDVGYLTSLSSDAVPQLLKAMPSFEKERRGKAAFILNQNFPPHAFTDPRTLNYGRYLAGNALADARPQLAEWAKDCPADFDANATASLDYEGR